MIGKGSSRQHIKTVQTPKMNLHVFCCLKEASYIRCPHVGQYVDDSQSFHWFMCLWLPAFGPWFLGGKKKENKKTLQ